MLLQRETVAQNRHIAQIGQRKSKQTHRFFTTKSQSFSQILGIEFEKINIENFANPE